MSTNISIEHFRNTATRDMFHLMRWSPRLNLNKGKVLPTANLPASFYMRSVCHNLYQIFVFSAAYTGSINQSHPDLLSNAPLGKNLNEIRNSNKTLFIHENTFEYYFCEVAVHEGGGGGGVKSVQRPTYLRVWVLVSMASTTGGAWNSLDTTEQTRLWYVILWALLIHTLRHCNGCRCIGIK